MRQEIQQNVHRSAGTAEQFGMDAAEPAHVGLNGFQPAQQKVKLARRGGVKLRLQRAQDPRGGNLARRRHAGELPFQSAQLRVQHANFRAKILLMRDVLMHGAQVERDVGRTAFIQVSGQQPQGGQTPLKQFQVALRFIFHIQARRSSWWSSSGSGAGSGSDPGGRKAPAEPFSPPSFGP